MEYIVLWLLFAVFSAVIASAKNKSAVGWFLIGLFFGPFGLVVGLLPSESQKATSTSDLGDFAVGYGVDDPEPGSNQAAPDESFDEESPIEMIEKLSSLRDSGAITEDEFEAKKKELLGRV